mmetsp:Transcript_46692/g.84256  ORF Transcript_46692/g.84256 Transcript_46692/m.84256 type:complete len:203 (+) Transcript_46692:1761-2369(+)
MHVWRIGLSSLKMKQVRLPRRSFTLASASSISSSSCDLRAVSLTGSPSAPTTRDLRPPPRDFLGLSGMAGPLLLGITAKADVAISLFLLGFSSSELPQACFLLESFFGASSSSCSAASATISSWSLVRSSSKFFMRIARKRFRITKFPNSTTIKKYTMAPLPADLIPSYITAFQFSPVRMEKMVMKLHQNVSKCALGTQIGF